MCKYPTKMPGLNCKNLKNTIDFNKRWRMLSLHNRIRMKFATGNMSGFPPAANMRILRWDFELEAVALRWAIQCVNRSDICRATPKYPLVGQNMAARVYKRFIPTMVIKGDWYQNNDTKKGLENGVKSSDGNQETLRNQDSPDMEDNDEVEMGGPADAMHEWVDLQLPQASSKNIKPFHYSWKTRKLFQVIWADTDRLGCSQVTYLNPQDWVTVAWVCNYATAGNHLGSPSVYEPGTACSRCPAMAECICSWGEPLRSSSQSRIIQDRYRGTSILQVTKFLPYMAVIIHF